MTKKIYLLIILGNIFMHIAQALPTPSQDQRVKKVYRHFHEQLVWTKNGQWTTCGQTLLNTLAQVDQDGLWQENYTPLLESIQKVDLTSPEGLKTADEILTLAALNYIADMKGGRLNPHNAVKEIYLKPQAIDETEDLKNYLSLTDQCGWIYALAPTSPEYQHLKSLLSSYRQKQVQGGWPQLPKGTKLEKGDKGALVQSLRAQLIAQDVLPSQGQGSGSFDEGLEAAVKNYQELHGLEPDGKVGGETLLALNTPVEDRIRSIIVSMERQRWFLNPLPSRYIQVNVPGFYLKAVNGGTPAFFMRIITGKEHTKTPVFNAPLKEIIFNPAWHVPASIARDFLPKIAANPEAYARKGYHVSANGRIVQTPGPGNALGKIRFTIESPYDIYLHGTPQEHLFLKAKRAYSHGCIRVSDPHKLAAFVFNDPEKWHEDRIKKEASGTQTKYVKLDNSLPVFITYFTVFEDESHKMHFVADEYGQDKKIWNALEELREKKGVNTSVRKRL